MKMYRPPALSRLAIWFAATLLPDRVYAAVAIMTLEQLETHFVVVDDHHGDGSRSIYDALPYHSMERLRRELWRNHLKAPLVEMGPHADT